MRIFPAPHVETVKKLRKEGKFGDLILFSWARVEETIDSLFLHDFDLEYLDVNGKSVRREFYEEVFKGKDGSAKNIAKVRFLLNVPLTFDHRYQYLKKRGFFESKEAKAIEAFQRARRDLFHGNLYKPFVLSLNEDERNRIMDIAVKADDAVSDASERILMQTSRTHVQPVNTSQKSEGIG